VLQMSNLHRKVVDIKGSFKERLFSIPKSVSMYVTLPVSAVHSLLARVRSSRAHLCMSVAFVHTTYNCAVEEHERVKNVRVAVFVISPVFLAHVCVQPCGRLHTR
jgi:hypothetical protein